MEQEQAPSWIALCGEERLEGEFAALRRMVKAGALPGVTKVSLPDDHYFCWRVKIESLDALTDAGMQLNTDLERLREHHGPAHCALLLELTFNDEYPSQPPFLRIVRPRVKLFSVHVTEGGSLCLEALVPGSNLLNKNGWRPHRTVGDILRLLLREFVQPGSCCEPAEMAASSSAGAGTAGSGSDPQFPRWPLSLHMELGPTVVQGYSVAEAQAAFRRMAWLKGWESAPQAAITAAAAAAAGGLSVHDGRLDLFPPLPQHWRVTQALLAGEAVFVDLPLPASHLARTQAQADAELLEEAARVLEFFQAGRASAARVAAIERVQNLELWHRYCRRREVIERESRQPDMRLFHGSSKEALARICRGGFDVRVANLHGSLGGGLYFGSASATSETYCAKQWRPPSWLEAQAGPARPAAVTQAAATTLDADPATPGAGPAGLASPRFRDGCEAMLVCSVAVGTPGTGRPGMREAEAGCHSSASSSLGAPMHCVYLSDQALPEYVIHFQR